MGHDPVAPDWAPWTEGEARALLARYPDAGDVEGLIFLSPRPFSSAALVATGRGAYFVKRHHRTVRDAEALREEHRFIAYLSGHGAPVASILLNADGDSVSVEGDWTVEVHRRARGDDLYREALSWTPFLTLGHARSAGRMLARLHRAAEGYDAPARPIRPLVSSFSIFASDRPARALEAYVDARPALARFLGNRPWKRDIIDLFAPAHASFSPYRDLMRPLWTHNDLHASNLTWAGQKGAEEAVSILDFGLADRTFALYDLATAVERNAVEWLERPFKPHPEQASALIAGYAEVIPLGPRERRALGYLLPLVHAEFALAEVDYFAGVTKDDTNAAIAYNGYLLGHASWFLGSEGRDFIHLIAGDV